MTAVGTPSGTHRIQMWGLVLIVLALIAVVPAILTADGGLLPERAGPPIEALAVERTTFAPGSIELTIRNTGPDPVQVAQVGVNDTYVDFGGGAEPIARLQSERLHLYYPWIPGQPYTISILTSTGLVIEHTIPAAATTPEPGADLIWIMTILGIFVGVIPVALGMLVLPALRRAGRGIVRVLLAVTVGLLGFLAVDAAVEGFALGELAGEAFGGPRRDCRCRSGGLPPGLPLTVPGWRRWRSPAAAPIRSAGPGRHRPAPWRHRNPRGGRGRRRAGCSRA